MNDREASVLRFSSAVLLDRLRQPIDRALRLACADLGVTPVVPIGAAYETVEATAERVLGVATASGPIVETNAAPARLDPSAVSRSLAMATTAVGPALESPYVATSRASDRIGNQSAATTPEASAPALDSEASHVSPATLQPSSVRDLADRVRLRPRARVDAQPDARSPSGVTATPLAPASAPGAAWHATPEVEPSARGVVLEAPVSRSLAGRVRLRPRGGSGPRQDERRLPSESTSPDSSASPGASTVIRAAIRAHVVPVVEAARSLTAASSTSSTPPLTRELRPAVPPIEARVSSTEPRRASVDAQQIARESTSWIGTRLLVPVVLAHGDDDVRGGSTTDESPWSAGPRPAAPIVTVRESDHPVIAPSLFERSPARTRAAGASSDVPQPRVSGVAAQQAPLLTPLHPSGISEHELAAVLAAAARRHGIDT